MKPLYFDTEFSSLNPDAQLISLGCVADTGQEFYAELETDPAVCSPFVIETVLPLLDGTDPQTPAQVAFNLKTWIESFPEECVLVSDAPRIDWMWIEDLFEKYGWPSNLNRRCGSLELSDEQGERFHRALEDYWTIHGDLRHHALMDAKGLQLASLEAGGSLFGFPNAEPVIEVQRMSV